MNHAVLTAWIAPMPIFLPRRFFDKVFEGWIMGISHQVTGTFPTTGIERWIAPRRAHHVTLARKEFQIDRRSHQIELFQKLAGLAKLFANIGSRHKYFFLLYGGIRIRGRNHETVNVKRTEVFVQFFD